MVDKLRESKVNVAKENVNRVDNVKVDKVEFGCRWKWQSNDNIVEAVNVNLPK